MALRFGAAFTKAFYSSRLRWQRLAAIVRRASGNDTFSLVVLERVNLQAVCTWCQIDCSGSYFPCRVCSGNRNLTRDKKSGELNPKPCTGKRHLSHEISRGVFNNIVREIPKLFESVTDTSVVRRQNPKDRELDREVRMDGSVSRMLVRFEGP